MPRYQLIKSLAIIYLFFQCLNVDKASGSFRQCHKGNLAWFCSEGKQCGDIYGSCKNDLKAVETTRIILLTIFSVFMIWFLVTSIYCFCSHRKRLAAGGFDPERRTINEAHIQQQVDIHINFDTPMNTELLIIEVPPPSYEQIQKKEAKDGCENI